MRVGIATDHGGFSLKQELQASIEQSGHEVVDFGAFEMNPNDDYPDYVLPLGKAVSAGEVQRGVAICTSGVGACIAANKVAGVRAALVHDLFSARQGVEDDDMNVLCIGARGTAIEHARKLIQTFLEARFSNLARHQRRLAKIAKQERGAS